MAAPARAWRRSASVSGEVATRSVSTNHRRASRTVDQRCLAAQCLVLARRERRVGAAAAGERGAHQRDVARIVVGEHDLRAAQRPVAVVDERDAVARGGLQVERRARALERRHRRPGGAQLAHRFSVRARAERVAVRIGLERDGDVRTAARRRDERVAQRAVRENVRAECHVVRGTDAREHGRDGRK